MFLSTIRICVFLVFAIFFFFGCQGGGAQENNTAQTFTPTPTPPLNTPSGNGVIEGKVTFEYVPGVSTAPNRYALDFSQSYAKPIRRATLQLIDKNQNILAQTSSDDNGMYRFDNIPQDRKVAVRVLAQLLQSTPPTHKVEVRDNTAFDTLYAMTGEFAVAANHETRNLHAPSGWNLSLERYDSERVAAPFAILDTIYTAMQKVRSAQADLNYPPLKIYWSTKNTPSSGDIRQGHIQTSYYIDGALYILGDANIDTDEYDETVIAHEWAHYYEDKLSRSDSIGGAHGSDELLDIRVAFSEGWGNAFAAMALDRKDYFDTFDLSQNIGISFDLERQTPNNAGWYSEASVQRILFDIYDAPSNDDDELSLGFGAIHHIMSTSQATTPAFTSIFSFIYYLKQNYPKDATAIDTLLAEESIAPIDDIWGSNRSNQNTLYPYTQYKILGLESTLKLDFRYGNYNKLGNHAFVRFHIAQEGYYTITARALNQIIGSDIEFVVFQTTPFRVIAQGGDRSSFFEQQELYLEPGSYLIDLTDINAEATLVGITIQSTN